MRSYEIATLALLGGVGAKILYAGVNESGGEFGSNVLPGEFGVQYQFTNKSTVDIFVNTDKINTFRVSFLLERMCPLATGLGKTLNETYWSEYLDSINHITNDDKSYAILDAHNYMRYGDPSSQPTSGAVIGSNTTGAATTAQFAEFWGEVASRLTNNSRIIYGIMNEPHDMPTSLIVQNDQAAINAIRAVKGANQLILAPGNGYTGGHSWNQSTCSGCDPNTEWLYKITDPLNNTAMDVHEYLDYDFSGQHQLCNQSGPANLAGLTSWLQQHNLKAFVSEFGGANNTQCGQYINDLLTYLHSNSEYIGWTAWAAGPFWGTSSSCCTDGAMYGSLEPGSTAAGGGPSTYNTVWIPFIEPWVKKLQSTLKRSGVSSLK